MYGDHKICTDEHMLWFMGLSDNQRSVYLVFEMLNKPIGMVYFTDIDKKNDKCFWGFYLGEENLPRGTGTVMGVLGMEFAFNNLNIRKLCGEVFQFNTASVNFFQKLGFSKEGQFINHVLKNGNYENIFSFSLFRKEWENNRAKLEETVFGGKVL